MMDDGVAEIKDLIFSDHNNAKIIQEDEERLKANGGVINNLFSALVTKDEEEQNREEKESGILNNLISNLVSPRVKESSTEDSFGGGDNEEKGKGGIFNNFISGISHQNDEEMKKEKNVVEDDELQAEDGGGGGGSLINNIVSHLPSPLSDDVAPATDEASILITSIVHD